MTERHVHTETQAHDGVEVIDCTSCGFRHQWPIPSIEHVRELYREEFGGAVKGGFAQRKAEDEHYWNLSFARRLRAYRELIDPIPATPRILDVGSGTGNLLRFFKSHGWDVQAIEPSVHFAEALAEDDIPNVPKLIDDMTDEDWAGLGKFDVINLLNFLEHVREPLPVLRRLAGHALADGGVLTIESPNDFNPLQLGAVQTQKLEKWWIHPLHINYFDFVSLERITRSVGLDPALREAQFPLEMFLLMGDVYIGDSARGRELHKKRVAFESALHETGNAVLLSEMYRALAGLGVGRAAIVHSVKRRGEA